MNYAAQPIPDLTDSQALALVRYMSDLPDDLKSQVMARIESIQFNSKGKL